MVAPYLAMAGLATSVGGTLLEGAAARKRETAYRRAARRMFQKREAEFNTAYWLGRENQSRFLNDPRRAELGKLWRERLDAPDIIDPGMLSMLKARSMDAAALEGGNAVTGLREQAQRAGLRTSPMGLGMEAAVRSRAFGRNAAISGDLDLRAKETNRRYRDETTRGYADYLYGDLQQEMGLNENLIQLLASKQYDPSSILAFM